MANGEGNRDGESNNRSWNCGVGRPHQPFRDVNNLRQRQLRNLFATLLFSQGIPMICGGDEVARTQQGNNNAYCQDNEISWTQLGSRRRTQEDLLAVRVQARSICGWSIPVLHRRRFFSGREPGEDVRTRSRRSNGSTTPARSWTWTTGQNTHAFSMMVYPERLAHPGG